VPRYVILKHDHPYQHWDLMLERGTTLRTWRLAACPEAGQVVPAEPLGDHRPLYLDYEGPVSGGRGYVVRWDAGQFTWEQDEPDVVAVRLRGQRLQTVARLTRDSKGTWSLWVGHPASDAPTGQDGLDPPR
jgi:hypothetical protein